MTQTTESPDDFKGQFPDEDTVNATYAAKFLCSISKSAPITIVCIGAKKQPNGKQTVIPRIFDPTDPDDVARMRSFIASQEMLPNNVYYVANITKGEQKMPGNDDMVALRNIVIDFDPDQTKPLEQERDRLRHVAFDLQNHPVKPRAIVNTGGGIQVIYELLRAIPFDDAFLQKTEDLMKRLARSQGADTKTCSVNHLFRVPYTYNWPNEPKEKAGRIKSVSSLWYAEGPRVAFEDLETLTTVSTADDGPEAAQANFEDLAPHDLVGVVGLPDNLPAELIDKARDPEIQKAINRAPKIGDRSGSDWFMAKTLIGIGLSDKDTAMLLSAYGHKTQEAYERSTEDGKYLWSYITKTVNDARRNFQKTTDKLHDFETEADRQEAKKERQERHARLKLLTYDESIEGIFDPVNSSLIAGLIQRGEVMVLYGKPSAGKTFAMLDLSFHIALGLDWNECKVKQASVVYIATEASLGIRYRIKALGDRYGAPEPDRFRLVPTAVDMFNRHVDLDKLIAEISKVEGEIGLIVIDTLSRSMMGGNENSAQDMMTLVKHGDLLRNKFGAALAWVHHSGKNEAAGARGSSALLAAVDVELEVADRCFRSTKMRDREHVDYRFELRVVEVGAMKESGEKVTSCIVDWQKGMGTEQGQMTNERRTVMVAADLLRDRGNTSPMSAKAIWELSTLLPGKSLPVKNHYVLAKALERSFLHETEHIFTRQISAQPRRNQHPVYEYGLVDW